MYNNVGTPQARRRRQLWIPKDSAASQNNTKKEHSSHRIEEPIFNAAGGGGGTVFTTVLSDNHGRQRRQERNIQKIDLQRARRYGMEEESRYGRLKYTYGGIVFVYDPSTGTEVTCFASSDSSSSTSGTKCHEPVLLSKKKEYETEMMRRNHELLEETVHAQPERWRSHSVLVVDMSGSMRRDDVNGARCRSDGVWRTLAKDFVQKQIENNDCTPFDVVSVVSMQDNAEIVVRCVPLGWTLYNIFLDNSEWKHRKPKRHGNYLPALLLAEKLLDYTPTAHDEKSSRKTSTSCCSLSLMFFSDGKPSDRGNFVACMGRIASKYGRRLAVSCIGMAGGGDGTEKEDFYVLQRMALEAKYYGSMSSFYRPKLTISSLSSIVTDLVTSITTSKTEMTNLQSGELRYVKTNSRREKINSPNDTILTNDWIDFRNNSHTRYVRRVWGWNVKKNDFVCFMDPRCTVCYTVVADFNESFSDPIIGRGILCLSCKVCFICSSCKTKGHFKRHICSTECDYFRQERISRGIIRKALPSFSMAMKVPIFGEGAERVVHKFRYLANGSSGKFIGPKMVAKESRFLEGTKKKVPSSLSYHTRMEYHRQFMKTQALAWKFARLFNHSLYRLQDYFQEKDHKRLKRLPRIVFLRPLVVEMVDKTKNKAEDEHEEINLLIEPFLEGNYTKFNNNMGYISTKRKKEFRYDNTSSVALLDSQIKQHDSNLDVIEEEDFEDDEDNSENKDDFEFDDNCGASMDNEINEISNIFGADNSKGPIENHAYTSVMDEAFPQAFSHFTYEKSQKQLIVVDLQGVLYVRKDRSRQYVLTDPAIHTRRRNVTSKDEDDGNHNHGSCALDHLGDMGRSDRGEKGIIGFFKTHVCTDACRLLGLTVQDGLL